MKTPVASSSAMIRVIVPVLFLGAVGGFAFWATTPRGNLLTDDLSVPLAGAESAKIELDTGRGNLTIDRLGGGEQMLATGTLQYHPSQGLPIRTVNCQDGQATIILKSGAARQSWFDLLRAASSGATDWQINVNPAIPSDITAHTGGGNVRLNLAGMILRRLTADSGGGNLDVVLPENAADLSVDARTGGGSVTVDIGSSTTGSSTINAGSGGGNVTVHVPSGLAARIHASSGMGKVMVDPRFGKLDSKTYQSPDYDDAANRVEITAQSGAGNVTVSQK